MSSDWTRLQRVWRFVSFFPIPLLIVCLLVSRRPVFLWLLLTYMMVEYLLHRFNQARRYKREAAVLQDIEWGPGVKAYYLDRPAKEEARSDSLWNIGDSTVLDLSPGHALRRTIVREMIDQRVHEPAEGDDLRVLDLGCQQGHVTEILVGKWERVFAIDISPEYLGLVTSLLKVPVVQADAEKLPFPEETFDLVVMTEILEHLPDPEQALSEVFKIVKPGGAVILSTPNRSSLPIHRISNVFMVLEKLLGLWLQPVLSKENLLWSGPEDLYLHKNFAHSEIKNMLRGSGFVISFKASYFFLPGSQRILGRLFSGLTLDRYADVAGSVEPVLRRIPVIKLLGDSWVFVLRKLPLS